MKSLFDKLTAVLFCLFLFSFVTLFLFVPKPETIPEERRLAQDLPTLSAEGVLSGEFMRDAEAYLLDAIPMRSGLVSAHANICLDLFCLPRCHGVRVGDHGLEKPLPAYDEALVSDNLDTITQYLQKFLGGKEAYTVLLPHKGYYTESTESYDLAWREIASRSAFVPIAVTDTLAPEDYFLTDIHIRPEAYGALMQTLSYAMDFEPTEGLFAARCYAACGTLALSLGKRDSRDRFSLLFDPSGVVASSEVSSGVLYDEACLDRQSADPYDLYLGGEVGNGVTVIRSPKSQSDRRLIVFRDSFMRAAVPYFLSAYREIVLIDLRTPYRRLVDEPLLYADDATDILIFLSPHTLLTTRF